MFNLLIFFLFPLLGAINSQSFPDPLSPEEEEKYLPQNNQNVFNNEETIIIEALKEAVK